eukprot:2225600-Amphidinium_carterae.1
MCSAIGSQEELRCNSADSARAVATSVLGPSMSAEVQARGQAFRKRFDDTFRVGHKVPLDEAYVRFAETALSSLLGGVGYFYGSSQVKHHIPTVDGESTTNTPLRPLFTAVPSRSFFPRGFLWDEGFHQLLLGRWSPSMSRDAISHWFGLMQSDGWIPREQILGAEAVSKVPDWAVPQHPTHANPPTLLLAIDSLMASAVEADATQTWLVSIFPAIEHWFRWLVRTQRGKEANSFRWHGRDPNDG